MWYDDVIVNIQYSTDDAILAECAVNDRIWGIGLSMHDNNRFDLSKWKGQNLRIKTTPLSKI